MLVASRMRSENKATEPTATLAPSTEQSLVHDGPPKIEGNSHQSTVAPDQPHAAVNGEAAADAPADPPKRKRGRRKLIHDEDERKLRRKMQCKLNQRRYRARQRGMITNLSIDTEKTNDDIQELEGYHRFLSRFDQEGAQFAEQGRVQIATDNRPALVVEHFLHLFRYGFALHSVEVSEIQENFLRFAMDQALISQGATQCGVDALILQLKRYTSYHAVFEVLVASTQVINATMDGGRVLPEAIVRASGKLHLRISRDTVMLLYPHIIDDEDLNSRVVGQKIYPTFSMVFHFSEHAKVVKFEFTVDFVSAFVELLQSVARTSKLLAHAIITPLSELGVDPHGTFNAKPKGNKQLSLKFILL